MLAFKLRDITSLLKGVDTVSPLNKELQVLLDLVLHLSDDHVPQLSGIVRHFGFKFASVLVHSSY